MVVTRYMAVSNGIQRALLKYLTVLLEYIDLVFCGHVLFHLELDGHIPI